MELKACTRPQPRSHKLRCVSVCRDCRRDTFSSAAHLARFRKPYGAAHVGGPVRMCSAAGAERQVTAYLVTVLPAAALRQLPSIRLGLREGQHRSQPGSGAALPPTVTCCSVPARAQPAALYSSGARGKGVQRRPGACAQVGDFEMRVQRSLTGGGGRGSFADSASVNGASSPDSTGAAEAAAPAVLDMLPPPAGTAFVSTYSMDSTVLLPEPEPEVKMMSTQSLDEDLEDESTIYLGSPKARPGSPCALHRPCQGFQCCISPASTSACLYGPGDQGRLMDAHVYGAAAAACMLWWRWQSGAVGGAVISVHALIVTTDHGYCTICRQFPVPNCLPAASPRSAGLTKAGPQVGYLRRGRYNKGKRIGKAVMLQAVRARWALGSVAAWRNLNLHTAHFDAEALSAVHAARPAVRCSSAAPERGLEPRV